MSNATLPKIVGVLLSLTALSLGLTAGYFYGRDGATKEATEWLNKTFRCIGLDLIEDELQCVLLERRRNTTTPKPPP